MNVSYQWLAEYVDVSGYTAAELAEKLTRSGIEVDVVENRNKGVSNVVVGYVKSRDKHPDADKLSVCTVDVGQDGDLQIVCGAKNVAAGQKVPVALIGAVLPDGLQIKRAKLRGVESQGMICSAKELGLNDRLLPKEIQEGILVPPETTPIGDSILQVLAIDDEVMELDLTPNRSDCLSMLGAAYEIAAILDREIKLPDEPTDTINGDNNSVSPFAVDVTAPEQCYRYSCRLLEGAVVGPAPLWMQNRLMAAGIRPINNVVDITNYVMLEYGQPLHAFDANVLSNQRIEVRLARPEESLVTLDDVNRKLDADMLVITDGNKPVAIAGVMGGANSVITADTTRILLESAHFAGGSVRKTSRRLGLRSESSLRFEKEVNPGNVLAALNRATALLCQYAGAKAIGPIAEKQTREFAPAMISVSLERLNGYLGTDLSLDEVKNLFNRLQFGYVQEGESMLQVHVPSRLGDISRDVDLIEEIARLYGYDRIPTTLMSGVTTPGALSKEQRTRRALRSLLTTNGLHEIISYTFTHPDQVRRFPGRFDSSQPVELAMPMSEERSTLRTSLIPHLLDTACYNRNRNMDDISIFEMGRVFITDEKVLTKLPQEKLMLAMLWTGKRHAAHWSGKAENVDFYDIKGVFDQIVSYLGIQGVTCHAAPFAGSHPGRTADIRLASADGQSTSIGTMGQLHPELQLAYDLADTYLLEVELDPLTALADLSIHYAALPRYPSASRDLAVVVDHAIAVSDLQASAAEAAGSLLESIGVFDVFTGERLGEDKKSIALSLVYRHPERTFTDEEVAELHERVVTSLKQNFAAELRK